MICKYCGNPLPNNAKFCAKCGAVQPEEPAPAPTQTEQPPEPAKKAKEKKNSPVVTIILAVLLVAALAAVAFLVYDNYIKKGPDESEAEKTTAAEETDTEALKENDPAPSAQPAAETQPAEPEPTAQPQPTSPEPAPGSPLTLKDVCFTVNGVTYSYPFSPDQFTEERGWTMIGGDPDKTVPADKRTGLGYQCGNVLVEFQYDNQTAGDLCAKECFLIGFGVYCDPNAAQTSKLVFPRGITPEATPEDLTAAYGAPIDKDEDPGEFAFVFCVNAPHPEQLADFSDIVSVDSAAAPPSGVPFIILHSGNHLIGLIVGAPEGKTPENADDFV